MATYTAGCSPVGGFGYANRFTLVVELSDSGGNSATNTSTVSYNVYFYNNSGGGHFSSRTRLYFALNGQVIRDQTLNVEGPRNGSVGIASGSMSVGHNNDGTKVIGFQAIVQGSTYGISSNCSGDFWLNTIPRYLDSYANSVRSEALNSVSINWSCSPARDHTQWSLNGGGWTNAGDTVASDNRSGYYTIGGLNPGTGYNVRTRLKRQDSQLWSETGYCYPKTKDYSKITGWTQLTLPTPGSASTINYSVSNPSGNKTYVYLERNNDGGNDYGCNSGSTSVSSGNKTLSLSAAAVNKIYSLHSSVTEPYNGNNNLRATSGMMITCRTTGNSEYFHCYNVTFLMSKANCGPTAIADFTCTEQNKDVAALTGCSTSTAYSSNSGAANKIANFKVLKGYSKVKINVPANPLTCRGGATNKSVSINGTSGLTSTAATSITLDKLTNNKFSVIGYDTRNFDLGKNADAVLVTYSPTIINSFKIDRGNGVDTTGYLTLSGTYNAVNFGAVTNSIPTVKLQVKTKATAWTAAKIAGAANGVIDASKVNEYTITGLITRGSGKFSCSNGLLRVSGNSGNNIAFALGTEYDVRIIVYDQLTAKASYSNQVVTKDAQVNSGKILFSAIKGEGVCFGTFYDSSVGGPLQVNKKEVLGATVISTWNT